MNLNELKITFDIDNIFDVTVTIFSDALKNCNVELEQLNDRQKLFSFYEKYISYPIDGYKDDVDSEREDFYETILIMSWAFFRQWAKCVMEKNTYTWRCPYHCSAFLSSYRGMHTGRIIKQWAMAYFLVSSLCRYIRQRC